MKVYVNGDPREIDGSATVAEVVSGAGETAPRGVAVAVDGSVVPRAELGSTTLHDGARIEIVTAVQGG